MGLVNLQTDLKSLKFDKDRRGGGKSNQPYVQVPIPSSDDDLSNFFLYGTGGPDFLLRGGTLLPNKIIQDEERLSKFFIDTKSPRGIFFITNQNLLSRTAVKTEASYGVAYGSNLGGVNEGVYLPLNTLLQAAGVAGGSHLYKQGIDPTGLSVASLNKYYDVVKNKPTEENRLFNLWKFRIEENEGLNPVLLEYGGGPGSILGIGTTKIKFAGGGSERTGINNPAFTNNNKIFLRGEYKAYVTSSNSQPIEGIGKQYPFNTPKILSSGAGALYNRLKNQQIISQETQFPTIYKSGSLDIDVNIDVKGLQKSHESADSLENQGSTKNFLNRPFMKKNLNTDIIDFSITIISNDGDAPEVLYFPAFLDSFTDNYSADWRSEKFMGRGEDFFTYNGFSRDVSLSFKVYASNRFLLQNMYDNLNKVASSLTPDYSSGGFMRGNIHKLTIGKYIDQLPGIITNLSFNIPVDSSWDIELQTMVPFYIEITSFVFKPIYNFLPNKNQKQFGRNVAPPVS